MAMSYAIPLNQTILPETICGVWGSRICRYHIAHLAGDSRDYRRPMVAAASGAAAFAGMTAGLIEVPDLINRTKTVRHIATPHNHSP